MSTNSQCLILQVQPNQWFYVLEHRDAPKNAWDWREHASAYGPFPSEEAAEKHLFDNHANPGGSQTLYLVPGADKLDLRDDKVLRDLLEAAPRNTRRTAC